MFQFAANGSGNGAGWGQGIRDCNLASGQNTESTAVEFGVAASDRTGRTAQGAYLDNVQITGFGVQLDYESQAWNIQVNHSELINAARHAIWTNPRAINMGESLNWNAVTVANSLGSWMMDAVDIANGSVIGNFIGSNFDNAEVTAVAGTINLTNAYFENPGPVVRGTPWIDIGRAVMTLTGGTFADDAASASANCITVDGSLSWFGGIMFGRGCADEVVLITKNGHASIEGDISYVPSVPLVVNTASGFNGAGSSVQWLRGSPAIVNTAARFQAPDTNAHWIDLENVAGSSTVNQVFLGQDKLANNNNFLLCLRSASQSFCPVQGSPEGRHVGFHGAPDSAVNQHFYGTNQFDHVTNGTGFQIAVADGCTISNGAIGNSCNTTVALPVAEPDDRYTVSCGATGGLGLWTVGNVNTRMPTSFVVPSIAMSDTATGGGTIQCTVVHD
jgi:hypothetical protein